MFVLSSESVEFISKLTRDGREFRTATTLQLILMFLRFLLTSGLNKIKKFTTKTNEKQKVEETTEKVILEQQQLQTSEMRRICDKMIEQREDTISEI